MVLIDDNTLVFASGTYIHYFDIPKKEVTFRKSVFGCGIGFITVRLMTNFYDNTKHLFFMIYTM